MTKPNPLMTGNTFILWQPNCAWRIGLYGLSKYLQRNRFSSGLAEYDVQPGDGILVMPQIDPKTMQYTSDIMQVIYQVAVSAAVVLRI